MIGLGWPRLAAAVADRIPPEEVDGLWLFPVLRHDGREWGTAVLARVDGERRRIYTARYMLAIKGKERGAFEASVQEVGPTSWRVTGEECQAVRRLAMSGERPDDREVTGHAAVVHHG